MGCKISITNPIQWFSMRSRRRQSPKKSSLTCIVHMQARITPPSRATSTTQTKRPKPWFPTSTSSAKAMLENPPSWRRWRRPLLSLSAPATSCGKWCWPKTRIPSSRWSRGTIAPPAPTIRPHWTSWSLGRAQWLTAITAPEASQNYIAWWSSLHWQASAWSLRFCSPSASPATSPARFLSWKRLSKGWLRATCMGLLPISRRMSWANWRKTCGLFWQPFRITSSISAANSRCWRTATSTPIWIWNISAILLRSAFPETRSLRRSTTPSGRSTSRPSRSRAVPSRSRAARRRSRRVLPSRQARSKSLPRPSTSFPGRSTIRPAMHVMSTTLWLPPATRSTAATSRWATWCTRWRRSTPVLPRSARSSKP